MKILRSISKFNTLKREIVFWSEKDLRLAFPSNFVRFQRSVADTIAVGLNRMVIGFLVGVVTL